jgi:hypothetical protein
MHVFLNTPLLAVTRESSITLKKKETVTWAVFGPPYIMRF